MKLASLYRATCSIAVLATVAMLAAQSLTAHVATSAARRHRRIYRHTGAAAATAGARRRPIIHSTTRAGIIHTNTAASLTVTTRRRRYRHHAFYNPWTEPTYADSTIGDNLDGEELVVRKAAVDALGPYHGTVVAADPQTGRILTIVNQKLATTGAFQPCSTVKMVVSLASLSEGIVDASKQLRITRRFSMDMTEALAHSNNVYFARLGQQLGFERVEKYGKLFGLGEKAGLDIPGEEPGFLADQPPQTGVGMMTSFGDGIRLTPLELTSIVTTIANGGTMYYLQYPRSQEEVQKFVPRIKRQLDIANFVPEIKTGLMGAVEYGTARRANFDMNEPIFGKTGTCTDTTQPGVHLGWFGSFNEVGKNKLVVVVLLAGGRGIGGSVAAEIAGNVYHNLSQQHYFAPEPQLVLPAAFVSTQKPLIP